VLARREDLGDCHVSRGNAKQKNRKHFGSDSEARKSLFLEEKGGFEPRALPVEKNPPRCIPMSEVTRFPDRNLTAFCHFPDT
jgi:hypothetical protein